MHCLLVAVPNALDHSGNRPVADRLSRVVATDEHIIEATA
jgi:hypothetical protein